MNKQNINIFYTDDDLDDREFFQDAAKDIADNLTITTQSNGEELMQMLHNPPPNPNILFLDLNMPVKNGYEVLKEIKEDDNTRHIPVIVFSTSTDQQAIKTSRELGANLYITKPSSFTSLKKVIRHSLTIDWNHFRPTPDEFYFKIN